MKAKGPFAPIPVLNLVRIELPLQLCEPYQFSLPDFFVLLGLMSVAPFFIHQIPKLEVEPVDEVLQPTKWCALAALYSLIILGFLKGIFIANRKVHWDSEDRLFCILTQVYLTVMSALWFTWFWGSLLIPRVILEPQAVKSFFNANPLGLNDYISPGNQFVVIGLIAMLVLTGANFLLAKILGLLCIPKSRSGPLRLTV